MKCKCNIREKLVGNGREACNPAAALECAKETIAELKARLLEPSPKGPCGLEGSAAHTGRSAPLEKFDPKQIARELVATALGRSYYGSALYAAKDIPVLTDEERWVVLRWRDGTQCGTDHVELQHIANKIAATA